MDDLGERREAKSLVINPREQSQPILATKDQKMLREIVCQWPSRLSLISHVDF